jgi:hypothetical protein
LSHLVFKTPKHSESASFGSKFIALKTAVEQVEALHYKLRMMGVTVDGPTNDYSGSKYVFKNVAFTESMLKKKEYAICYHKARDASLELPGNVLKQTWQIC